MKNSFLFFENINCNFYPCHKGLTESEFNCIFCFCPLYLLNNECGGNFTYTENGHKDCSNCIIPHKGIEGYKYICKKLNEAVFDNKNEDFIFMEEE